MSDEHIQRARESLRRTLSFSRNKAIVKMILPEATAFLRADENEGELPSEHVIAIKGSTIIIDGEALKLGGERANWFAALCENAGHFNKGGIDRRHVAEVKSRLDKLGYGWLADAIENRYGGEYCLHLPENCRVESHE